MYIKAAEHQMFEDEPEPSRRQFTEIYPYAFAMGLNTVWADKFSRELALWANVSTTGTSEHSTSFTNFENSISSFETDFSGAANYTPASSSDGGGGGGGDGGGGGGGGGD